MYALALTLCLMAEGHPACRVERVYTSDCVEAVRYIRSTNPSEAKVTGLSCVRVNPEDIPDLPLQPVEPQPQTQDEEDTSA